MRLFGLLIFTGLSLNIVGCKVGKGCPSNGKNVGAEKILSGDIKAIKSARKAGKFRS